MAKKAKTRRSWLRRLRNALLAALVLLAVLLVAAKYWIVPAVVRWQIDVNLRKHWDGSFELDEFEFNYLGPIYLRGLHVRDSAGREWLRVRTVKLTLSGYPGLNPTLSEVEVDGVAILAHARDGSVNPPVRRAPPSGEPGRPGEYIDLRRISVRNVTLAIMDERGNKLAAAPLDVRAERKSDVYDLNITWGPQDDAREFNIRGTIHKDTLHADLVWNVRRAIGEADSRVLCRILNSTIVQSFSGRVRGKDIRIRGDLSDPASLRPAGTLALRGWRLANERGGILDDLKANVLLGGSERIAIVVPDLEARVCKGGLDLKGQVLLRPSQRDDLLQYQGRLAVEKPDLSRLAYVLTGNETVKSGTLRANIAFLADGPGPDDLRVRGVVFLDDANYVDPGLLRPILGLFDEILRKIGLQDEQLDAGVDAEFAFDLKNRIIIIERGRIGQPFAALAIRKGGTINLKTRELDFYVVGATLSDIKTLLKHIPLMSVFADLTGAFAEKVTAVHVKGKWTEPPERIVGKEPVKDLEEGTIDFFRDMLKSGGQIGADVFGGFEELFKLPGSLFDLKMKPDSPDDTPTQLPDTE